MLEKSLSYERLGADGLLLITPYYNKTNEEGMYLHFKTVADAVKIPCILYNVPGRTGCSISVANVARLSQVPLGRFRHVFGQRRHDCAAPFHRCFGRHFGAGQHRSEGDASDGFRLS